MVKWSSGTDRPHLDVPAGAVDCHHHIYDARFPPDPRAALRPEEATVADYRALQRRLGTARNVVVQPSTYGTDNACLIEALAAFGPAARGVAVVDEAVGEAELAALHRAGVRGIRFNLVQAAATTADMLAPLGARVHALGWHIQLNITATLLPALALTLGRLACPVVFDHLAHLPPSAGPSDPAFIALARLLENGRTWVKLSGAYLESRDGPPDYADTTPLAQSLVRLAPERMVWGSDWPHPTAKGEKPDDARLLDLLGAWVPDAAARRRVLVDNACTLYGFPADIAHDGAGRAAPQPDSRERKR